MSIKIQLLEHGWQERRGMHLPNERDITITGMTLNATVIRDD
jgi:hypothetical protein